MLHQSPSSDTSSPAEISISREYLSAIPLFSPAAVSRLGTWSDIAPEETYTFHIPQSEMSTGSRFFRPSLPVTIKRSPARSTLKIPSKVPPKNLPSRVYEQDLWRHVPRSLPSTAVPGLKTWSDSASEESKLSSFFSPKQGFRPLHYQAEHPHLPQDGYVLKYHNAYHSYIIHTCHIIYAYVIHTHHHASYFA